MNNYYEETRNNCRDFIGKDGRRGFEVIEGSFEGYLYMKKGIMVKLRVHEKLSFLVMEVFPGIIAHNSLTRSLVAEYCQRVTPVPAIEYLAVSFLGEIYCHVGTGFDEKPLSEKVLSLLETRAFAMLDRHKDALEGLVAGRFVECFDTIEAKEQIVECTENNIQETVGKIKRLIVGKEKNIIGTKVNNYDTEHFFIETVTREGRFLDGIYVKEDGWVIFTSKVGFRVTRPNTTQIAQLCNTISDESVICFLSIDEGYPCASVATRWDSFNESTFEKIEMVLKVTLHENVSRLALVGCGVGVEDEGDEDLNFEKWFCDGMKGWD